MQVNITINAYDAIAILRAFYKEQFKAEIGQIDIVSWRIAVLSCSADNMLTTDYGTKHRLRIGHSSLFNPDGTQK